MFTVPLIAAEQHDKRNMLRVHRRKLRDSTDPFDIPEQRFKDLYRLSKSASIILLNDISPYMRKGVTKTFIPQPLRMCAALHFFATGSFYRDIGQDFEASMSKSMVSRCVHEIANILESKLMAKWIQFPTPSEYESIKERFYEQTGFPGVIGAIDCTHVRIKRPKKDVESCYLNRKGYHSKNVQLVCDFNLKIFGGFARFGGAAHDSYIWEASRINTILQQRFESDNSDESYFLGDSGYPLRPWLITPYRSSANDDEKRFNTIHAKTRNCVERLNGVLKSVFRCLQVGLHTTPQAAGRIINACLVLHNFRVAHGILNDVVVYIDDEEEIPIDLLDNDQELLQQPLREGSRLRDRLKGRFSRRN